MLDDDQLSEPRGLNVQLLDDYGSCKIRPPTVRLV